MATPSTSLLPLGAQAPDFSLPDAFGKTVSLSDFKDAAALLVVFMCNHCPFVKRISGGLAQLALDYQPHGVAVVGINANDFTAYPEDAPQAMRAEIKTVGYPFSYLVDEAQSVAKAYRAACTPDIYLFDRERKLAYHGQFDDSRPSNQVPATGTDLRAALDAVLAGQKPAQTQKSCIGCSIKWKPGNEPGTR